MKTILLEKQAPSPLRSVALLLAQFMGIFGIYCLIPPFHLFDSSPIYAVFQQVAPQWAWGIFAVTVSGFKVWAILNRRAIATFFISVIMTAWFAAAAIAFYVSARTSPATPIYILLAAWQLKASFNAGTNLPPGVLVPAKLAALLNRFVDEPPDKPMRPLWFLLRSLAGASHVNK